jgi:uncharacterized membrane protein
VEGYGRGTKTALVVFMGLFFSAGVMRAFGTTGLTVWAIVLLSLLIMIARGKA